MPRLPARASQTATDGVLGEVPRSTEPGWKTDELRALVLAAREAIDMTLTAIGGHKGRRNDRP